MPLPTADAIHNAIQGVHTKAVETGSPQPCSVCGLDGMLWCAPDGIETTLILRNGDGLFAVLCLLREQFSWQARVIETFVDDRSEETRPLGWARWKPPQIPLYNE